jgi:hypothetical protein
MPIPNFVFGSAFQQAAQFARRAGLWGFGKLKGSFNAGQALAARTSMLDVARGIHRRRSGIGLGAAAVGAYAGYANSPDHPILGAIAGGMGGMTMGRAGATLGRRVAMDAVRGRLTRPGLARALASRGAGFQLGMGAVIGLPAWW